MTDFDFVKEQEKKIIDSLNEQQSVYIIKSKNQLSSKNPIYFGTKRSNKNSIQNNYSNSNLDASKYRREKLYALKLVKYHRKKQIAIFNREKDILDSFSEDERIIKYLDIIMVQNYCRKHLLISMDYYQFKDILYYLWRPNFSFDENLICVISFKALNILQLLKSRFVVHNDIKFENFIITSEYPLKILLTDFESAQTVDSNGQSTIIAGTPIFKSPEVLKKVPHSYEADMWSLAISIFYHLCNEYPFDINEEENNEKYEDIIFEKIKSHEIERKSYYQISDEAWQFLCLALEKDPNKRLKVEDALKLDWFKYMDKIDKKFSNSQKDFNTNLNNEIANS